MSFHNYIIYFIFFLVFLSSIFAVEIDIKNNGFNILIPEYQRTDYSYLGADNIFTGDNTFLNVTIINQSILNVNDTILINDTSIFNYFNNISDHNLLNNLGWADANHTMDTDLDMMNNSIHNISQLNITSSTVTDAFIVKTSEGNQLIHTTPEHGTSQVGYFKLNFTDFIVYNEVAGNKVFDIAVGDDELITSHIQWDHYNDLLMTNNYKLFLGDRQQFINAPDEGKELLLGFGDTRFIISQIDPIWDLPVKNISIFEENVTYFFVDINMMNQNLTNVSNLNMGDGLSDSIKLTFDGSSNDGYFEWDGANDYFKFTEDIFMDFPRDISFRDAQLRIGSPSDGHLEIDADISIDLDSDVLINENLNMTNGNITDINHLCNDTTCYTLSELNTTIPDTNASNCADGEYLDGNGNCIPFNSTVRDLSLNQTESDALYLSNSGDTGSGAYIFDGTGNVSFNTSTVFIDYTTGRVGIGTTTPLKLLHVYDGASGYSYNVHADAKIVVEDNDNAVFQFITPNNKYVGVIYTDNTAIAGSQLYYHNNYPTVSMANDLRLVAYNDVHLSSTVSYIQLDDTVQGGDYYYISDTDTGFDFSANTIDIKTSNSDKASFYSNYADFMRVNQYYTKLYAAHSFLSLIGEGTNDVGMTGMYDRNELKNAYLKTANVSVTIVGSGNVIAGENYNNLFDSTPGNIFDIQNLALDTSEINITVDMGEILPHYGSANWRPFIQYRLGMTTATYFDNITVYVSDDAGTWYKPSSGAWETGDASGDSQVSSYWFGTKAFPNSPANLPGSKWRYARFQLRDIQMQDYAYNETLWLSQIGITHTAAPWDKGKANTAGDTFYDNVFINSNTTNTITLAKNGTITAVEIRGDDYFSADDSQGLSVNITCAAGDWQKFGNGLLISHNCTVN